MSPIDRRRFLSLLVTGVATPAVLTLSGCGAETQTSDGTLKQRRYSPNAFQFDSQRVFSLSVASGDPTPAGVILWTRIDPTAYLSDAFLQVEVAEDEAFTSLVYQSIVLPQEIGPHRDYTVSIDVDGHLQADRRYYYRFIYDNTVSRTGRCKTAPLANQPVDNLKFAVLTCQDFTNGYYGALNYVAQDDSIDFVIHLGDFIYESAGDPRYQALPFEDRLIILPSDYSVAMNLDDYRFLYRTYRRDPNLQLAMERHTWIITRDDHETANDAYWDYARGTLGVPDHPYTLDKAFNNDPLLLNKLMLDSQQAWVEYVPARVQVDLNTTDPHQFLKYYRHLQFGDMLNLFMMDTRTYRTSHPCGEKDFLDRYFPIINCTNWTADTQFMLGNQQREWLLNGLIDSSTRWNVLGNQTFMGPLWIGNNRLKVPFNVDAWDGYDHERLFLADQIHHHGVENLVVLTGDLHTYMASHVKRNYYNTDPRDAANHVGVEFMTPSVTSAGMLDILLRTTPKEEHLQIMQWLSNEFIKLTNPHVRYFNSIENGFSTVEFTRDHCDWRAYSVNKNINATDHGIHQLQHWRKEVGNHQLQRIRES